LLLALILSYQNPVMYEGYFHMIYKLLCAANDNLPNVCKLTCKSLKISVYSISLWFIEVVRVTTIGS